MPFFHNGAAALSDVTRRVGLLVLILHGCVTMSPDTLFIAWVVYKINQRNAILLGLRYFLYPEMDGTGEGASGIHPKK